MKSYRPIANYLLGLIIVALAISGCASKNDVKSCTTSDQPSQSASSDSTSIAGTVQEEVPAPATLESFTLIDQAQGCSLRLNTNTAPQYTVFKLSEPNKIIVDLPGFMIADGARADDIANAFIAQVTTGKIEDDERNYLRVEIALNVDCVYNAASDDTSIQLDLTKKPESAADASAAPAAQSAEAGSPQKAAELTPVITGISPISTAEGLKIAISSNRGLKKYHAYTLQNPNRIVIDIPKASSDIAKPGIPLDSAPVSQIRVGTDKNKVRIVMDITGDTIPEYQVSQREHSLVVHFQPSEPATVAAAESPDPAAAATEPASGESEPAPSTAPAEAAVADETESDAQFSGPKISLDFKDADLKNVLRLIADISGTNMIISDSVEGKVTLKLDNIPVDEALELVLETNGLGKMVTKNITRIETREQIKRINEEKLLAKKSHEEVVDLVIKTYDISYAQAQDIAAFIESMKILSDRGSITSFSLTNKVTVQDIPENIPKIAALIREQDVPTRQVMIEARIVQSNPSFTKELGIRWGGLYNTTHDGNPISIDGAASDDSNNYLVNLPAAAGEGAGGAVNFGYIKDNMQLNLQLTALENEDKIKIISNPRIIGLDNQEARIKQGVALPYLKLSSEGVTSTEFKDAVLELEVKPKITPSNTVALEVMVTKNQKSSQTGAGNEPGIDIREVETNLLLKSGVTVVIGGIYETTKSLNVHKVPFFGDIPYLSYFFKSTKEEEQLTELLVFITVTVLDPPQDIAQGPEDFSS